jgi:hypothetical protein
MTGDDTESLLPNRKSWPESMAKHKTNNSKANRKGNQRGMHLEPYRFKKGRERIIGRYCLAGPLLGAMPCNFGKTKPKS